MARNDSYSAASICWFGGCYFRIIALKSQFALSFWFTSFTYVIMRSRISRKGSNQHSMPLVIVCGALSTTGLDLLKLKTIYSDLRRLKNRRIFSVIKLKLN